MFGICYDNARFLCLQDGKLDTNTKTVAFSGPIKNKNIVVTTHSLNCNGL